MRILLLSLLLSCSAAEIPTPNASLPNSTTAPSPPPSAKPASTSSPTSRVLPVSAPQTLTLPTTKLIPPKRYKPGRTLLDCANHKVWQEPSGWLVTEFNQGVLAYAPDLSAAIFRGHTKDSTGAEAQTMAEALAAVPIQFQAPVREAKHKWSWKVTTHGEGLLGERPVRVTLIQENPRSQGDGLWVLVSSGADAESNHSLMEASVTGMLMLADHSCACGYDCYRKTAVSNATR
jgi:hypothetical protein